MRISKIWVWVGIGLSLAIAGCTKKSETASSAPQIVNLAIWSNYISPETIGAFEKQTGIKVQVSNYSSNEELLAKLQAGATGYDVVVPSDYMVFAMTKLGLLEDLDHSKLPNLKSLDPRFLQKQFDPKNQKSVPYDWGTTGIAVNTDQIKTPIKGWKDLFEKPELAGKLTLLDDARETIGAALKSLGYSLNSTKPEELDRAKAVILKARARVKAFTSEPMVPLKSGETAVAHAYQSDALQAARDTGGKVTYVLPAEGGTLWIDNLVIPKGAPHLAAAHQFINYLLEPKVNVATVQAILVSPANLGAMALLPADLKKNPSLFPSEAVLKKFEMMQDLGESSSLWDRIWTEIKAADH